MSESALGSVLLIPESALKKIKEADERLEKLQKTSKQTAAVINASCQSMKGSTDGFIGALDQIIQKLGTIKTAAGTMSGSLSSLGTAKVTQGFSKMGDVVSQTAQHIDRMAASQHKAASSPDLSKSVSDWQNIQAQIDKTTKRQEELTKSMRQYEYTQQRIKEGKGGVVYNDEKALYAANVKEYETNRQVIASLREKQQAIIQNNQAINQQIALAKSLKQYGQDFPMSDARYKAEMQMLKESIQLRAKKEAEAKKSAEAEAKSAEAEAKSEEAKARRVEAAAQKEYTAKQKVYQASNYKQNTTYQGALSFSESANTLNRQAKAVQYLEAAKRKLSVTDADYKQKLDTLNASIERHNKVLQEAKAASQRANSGSAYYADTNAVLTNTGSAATLREHVAAIKELQQARLSLNTTDKNYKQNLASVNEAIKQHSTVLKEAGVNARNLGEQTSYMAGYLSRWAQRVAFAFSLDTIKNFIGQVAEARGQFELSERSLEAILQNKTKADEIFNKTVELAVKSPFRIKDLVDYTRQLSAYRIESDKLYDTTKRLADVSAGLGVDMGRLILAYGQVKAAAYLRGSEVRQFTEAGINIYGELQDYFKEVKGEAYTTAQILDMISKRKVTFEDVEAIFQRMTDKGGIFYNMQEVQAETLQGKISNLKDAFDVMLNDIGKSSEGTLKTMVSWTTSMLNNWESIATALKALIAMLLLLRLQAAETGVGMSRIFSVVAADQASKSISFLQLFKKGLKSAGTAAMTFGKNLTSAIASNAWLIAISLAIQAVWSIGKAIYDYNQKIKKAEEETIKARGEIDAIANSYNNLAKSAKNASEISLDKNLDDRRAQLQKLIDLASKDGLTFKINVEQIDEKKLDETFRNVEKKYKDFIDDLEVIRRNYAKNDVWNTWFTDGLDDDAEDYRDAVVDVLSKSSQMERIIANINSNYKNATTATKQYFDEIRKGQKENESNIDYQTRIFELLKKINNVETGSVATLPDYLKGVKDDFYDLWVPMNKVFETSQELEREFDNVFGDLRKKYNNDPVQIQAHINKIAAEKDWNQYERDLAYRHFGINVFINKDTMEKQVSWVDDFISRFFAEKRYGITLSVNEIKDTSSIKEYLDKSKEFAETAKEWKQFYENVSKATVKEYNVVGKLKDLLQGTLFADAKTITKKQLMALAKSRMRENTISSKNLFGVDPFEKQSNKVAKQRAKEQRDILQERISLLKDMNQQYNTLLKSESEEQALTKTRSMFELAARNVGLNAKSIMPDDATTAREIEKLGARYKELAKKSGAFRTSAEIKLHISEKEYEKMREGISSNIDEAFNGLQLYKKLKGEGLSDRDIKSMFGDIATSFDDVRNSIDDEFNKYVFKDYESKYGSNINKWGEEVIKRYNNDIANTANVLKERFGDSDIYKDYQSRVKNINKQEHQDQVEQAQELIKAYKQQLSDQLQLDRWYIDERNKLQNNTEISKTPDLQKQLQENLDMQYKRKTDENVWKDFQNSDMYVRLFENLDQVSSKALDAMATRLRDMRDNLKNLDPTQLKAIVDKIKKVDDVRNSRNPFKAFTSGLEEMIKAGKDLKKNGGVARYVELNDQSQNLKVQLEASNRLVELLELQYNEIEKINGKGSDEAKAAAFRLSINKGIRDNLKSQLNLTDQQVAKLGAIMTEEEQAKAKFSKSVTDITDIVSSMASAFGGLFEALGGSDEQLQNTLGIVDSIGQAVGSYNNYAGVVSGAVGALTGIVKLFNNESSIDKEIKRQERAITKLQKRYEELKKSMDDAFSTERLYKYNQQSVEALEKEKASYEAMIKAEQGRKHADEDKIQSWRSEITSIDATIKELSASLTEELGGFGSQANYKSAAEAFASAWVDAFNEGSDSLDALNEKFDEYFNNLLTKQVTQRASEKFIKPILESIDKAVAVGSEGGNNGLDATTDELAEIKKVKDQNLEAYNEYLKNMFEMLGVNPTGTSNISSLQQGIQSVTEATAQALESIINSIRYYLATQQADVRVIKDTLLQRLGSIASQFGDSSNNIMVSLMQQQVGYLRQICDNWSSVMKLGHSKGGAGLKVFLN
nr:MAG TPA: tail tape measure [Caudoviricetes sp.]